MKAYLAKRGYEYEGFEVIGVFTRKEDAQKCCDNDFYKDQNGVRFMCGDYHEVSEHEVENSIKQEE